MIDSSLSATCSAELYSCFNCSVTTIFHRSSLFLDDFDDVHDIVDVILLMIDVSWLKPNIFTKKILCDQVGVKFYPTPLHH